jgi:hypothetical protein
MNSQQQKEFLQANAWLRPWTRWAAGFSLMTAGFLPASIRNIPLALVRRILARHHKGKDDGCKTC